MHCLFPFFVVYERMTILAEEGFPIVLLLFIRFITRIFLAFRFRIAKVYNAGGTEKLQPCAFSVFYLEK